MMEIFIHVKDPFLGFAIVMKFKYRIFKQSSVKMSVFFHLLILVPPSLIKGFKSKNEVSKLK